MAWPVVRLGEVTALITKGTTPTTVGHSYVEQGINFVKVEAIAEDGSFKIEKFAKVTEDCHNAFKRSQIAAGDILFSIAGALGRCAIANNAILPANTNQAVAIVRLSDRSILLPEYVLYALKSGAITEQIDLNRAGSAQQNLSLSQLSNFTIPLPPLEEQRRIVAVLDEAFAAIATATANAEKNLANARELFEGYLNDVFTHKGDEWPSTSLGEAYDVRDGTHDSPRQCEKGYPLVTSKNLKRGYLDFSNITYISEHDYNEISKRSKVDQGDVLLAMIGTIGNPVVVTTECSFAIKNVALFKIPNDRSGEFLRYYLKSNLVVSRMQLEAKGTTQKFVGLGYLRNFPIRTPSGDVELEIVDRLRTFEDAVNDLEEICSRKLAALSALKQSLLHCAFTGELTATPPELVAA